jgi:IS30 family transposase
MARGWESKSVEAQQEDAASANSSGKPRLTRQEADRIRDKESLRLSLSNIEAQLARSRTALHREMLERAKADLQRRIEKLAE